MHARAMSVLLLVGLAVPAVAQELGFTELRWAKTKAGCVFVGRLTGAAPANPLFFRTIARAASGTAVELYVDREEPIVGGLLPGTGAATELELLRVDQRASDAEPVSLGKVHLAPPAELDMAKDVVTRWLALRRAELERRILLHGRSSYEEYLVLTQDARFESPAPEDRQGWSDAWRRPREVDLWALSTGALAIQEALQLDALAGGTGELGEATVKIATLEGPQIESHPYEQMLGGKEPPVEPISRLVPIDQWYLRAGRIEKLLELASWSEDWGDQLLVGARVASQDRRLAERYLGQMALARTELTRWLGDQVVGEIALTGSDPFFREGSDLSLILEVKNAAALALVLDGHLKDALAARADATQEALVHRDVAIRAATTPDRELSSFRAQVGPYFVVSNSLAALRRVIDASRDAGTSMMLAPDFRYMRSLYPPTDAAEDAFVYLSDAWVRRIVGPRTKLANIRRMRCAARLQTVQNARLAWLAERLSEPTLADLVREGYLPAHHVACPAGAAYALDKGDACCAEHRRLGFLAPLNEHELISVSEDEAQGYRAFVEDYKQYWREFFDPIGIQVRLRDGQLRLETRILPLVSSSIYTGLRDAAGEPRPLDAHAPADLIGQLRLGLDPAVLTKLGRQADEVLRELGQADGARADEAFGSELVFRVHDTDPLFTWDNAIFGELYRGSTRGGGLRDEILFIPVLLALNFPVSAEIPVKDAKLARRFVDVAEQLGQWQARERELQPERRFFQDPRLQLYRYAYQGADIGVVEFEWIIKLRFFYCLMPDRLIVATKRPLIERLVAERLGIARAQPPAPVEAVKAHLLFELHPAKFAALRPTASLHWQEQMQRACFANHGPLAQFHRSLANPREGVALDMDRALGYRPFCPAGGAYRWRADADQVDCSVHGTPTCPRLLDELPSRLPQVRRMESLRRLRAELEFTPEGLRTVLTIDTK